MNQSVCDRARVRTGWAIVPVEPLGVGNLVFLQINFSAFIFCRKSEHQLVGEGPTLATAVTDVLHLDADFFLQFALYGVFGRFTTFNESSNAGVDVLIALNVASKKYFVAFVHKHNHARFYARKMDFLANGALSGRKSGAWNKFGTASATILGALAPVSQGFCA